MQASFIRDMLAKDDAARQLAGAKHLLLKMNAMTIREYLQPDKSVRLVLMMETIFLASGSRDERVVVAALQCLKEAARHFDEELAPFLEKAFDTTTAVIRTWRDEPAREAIEFWCFMVPHMRKRSQDVICRLLPVLLETTLHDRINRSASERNMVACACECIREASRALDQQITLDIVLPWVQAHADSKDWRARAATLLCVGSLARGIGPEQPTDDGDEDGCYDGCEVFEALDDESAEGGVLNTEGNMGEMDAGEPSAGEDDNGSPGEDDNEPPGEDDNEPSAAEDDEPPEEQSASDHSCGEEADPVGAGGGENGAAVDELNGDEQYGERWDFGTTADVVTAGEDVPQDGVPCEEEPRVWPDERALKLVGWGLDRAAACINDPVVPVARAAAQFMADVLDPSSRCLPILTADPSGRFTSNLVHAIRSGLEGPHEVAMICCAACDTFRKMEDSRMRHHVWPALSDILQHLLASTASKMTTATHALWSSAERRTVVTLLALCQRDDCHMARLPAELSNAVIAECRFEEGKELLHEQYIAIAGLAPTLPAAGFRAICAELVKRLDTTTTLPVHSRAEALNQAAVQTAICRAIFGAFTQRAIVDLSRAVMTTFRFDFLRPVVIRVCATQARYSVPPDYILIELTSHVLLPPGNPQVPQLRAHVLRWFAGADILDPGAESPNPQQTTDGLAHLMDLILSPRFFYRHESAPEDGLSGPHCFARQALQHLEEPRVGPNMRMSLLEVLLRTLETLGKDFVPHLEQTFAHLVATCRRKTQEMLARETTVREERPPADFHPEIWAYGFNTVMVRFVEPLARFAVTPGLPSFVSELLEVTRSLCDIKGGIDSQMRTLLAFMRQLPRIAEEHGWADELRRQGRFMLDFLNDCRELRRKDSRWALDYASVRARLKRFFEAE